MSSQRLALPLALLILLFVSPLSALTVSEQRLDNGLNIVVVEDHRAPVVVSQLWYRVGSAYEPSGLTGISHLLEHMMFKGTETVPPGRFSEIVAAHGGNDNAFTSRDYTAYYQQLASEHLELALRLEADRMRNLLLDPEEFQSEQAVVQEERRLRTEDKPRSLTYERFQAVAFLNSPYRNPVIGWMEDIGALTIDDLREWYRTWYAPNNATLVIVGDVQPNEVFTLAEHYFGEIPEGSPVTEKVPAEPRQRGTRRVTVSAPAKLPYLLMGYKVPVVATSELSWEPYALEVLAGILDGGDSARLTDRLIRGRELAVSAGAGYNAFASRETLFLLAGVPREGESIETLEAALKAELELLKNERVDAAELARVKAQVVASDVYDRDSVLGMANTIGALETNGYGWEAAEQYVARIMAVTAEQVQQVSRRYLDEERLTVGILDPQPIDDEVVAAVR